MYPFWLLGASYLIPSIIKYLTSEIGLTNKRLIEKRGWISVQVREFDVREISGATVDTGMLGRIFGYGFVHVDCRFITDLTLDAIPNAHRLVSALNDVREHALAEAQAPHADAALQDIDDQSGPPEDEKKTKTLQPATPAPTPQHDATEADHEDTLSRKDVADAIAAAIPAIASKVAEELSHNTHDADTPAPTPHTPGQTANEQVAEDVLAENFDAASTVPDVAAEAPKPTLQ